MSLKSRLIGAVSPFAHLNGPVVKPAAVTDRANPGAVVDDPAAQTPPAPVAKTDKKAKKAKKSETDDQNDDEEGSDDEDGDQDSDEEEMREQDAEDGDDDMKKGKKAFHNAIRAARLRERARCAAIFGAEEAGGNPALAAQLAFMGNTGRDTAIGILAAAGPAATAKTGLAARMANVPQPVLSAGGDGDQKMRPGDRALAALAAARGKAA